VLGEESRSSRKERERETQQSRWIGMTLPLVRKNGRKNRECGKEGDKEKEMN
jgi:hypothetical protein